MKRALILVGMLCLALNIVHAQGTVEPVTCAATAFGYKTFCGFVTLPQDYDNPESNSVHLFYIQIKSRNRNPQLDPLVYLVGGPGSSGSQLMITSFRAYLQPFADERDIVIIDQRGTGLSRPSLECNEAYYDIQTLLTIEPLQRAARMLDVMNACYERLADSGIRLDTFHSANIAHDVNDLLLTLGYEQWNLIGVSYGSRLALTMMRDYPEHIRSVILDSVYPPQVDLYFESYYNAERALDELFLACEADVNCNSRYPHLKQVFFDLYDELNEHPAIVTVSLSTRMPPLDLIINGYRFYDWVFLWLYNVPNIQRIPAWIYQARDGELDNVVKGGALVESSFLSISLGMHYAVQCQEEFPFPDTSDGEVRIYDNLIETYPHLKGYLDYPIEGPATLGTLCNTWQTSARDLIENEAVASDIPTLLLSGNFDPITPPEWAKITAESLSTAYQYVLPYVGHGVMRSTECAVDIALEFINAPDTEPNSDCIVDSLPLRFD